MYKRIKMWLALAAAMAIALSVSAAYVNQSDQAGRFFGSIDRSKTHTFVYFTYDQGLQNVAIVGEIVTRIRSKDLITMANVTGDGIVDIRDFAALAVCNQWNEDR